MLAHSIIQMLVRKQRQDQDPDGFGEMIELNEEERKILCID